MSTENNFIDEYSTSRSARKSHVMYILVASLVSLGILCSTFYLFLDISTSPSAYAYLSHNRNMSKYIPALTMSYTNCTNTTGVHEHIKSTAITEAFMYPHEFKRIHPCCTNLTPEYVQVEKEIITDKTGYKYSPPSNNVHHIKLIEDHPPIIHYNHINMPSPSPSPSLPPEAPLTSINDLHVVILTAPSREKFVAATLNTWAAGVKMVSVISNEDLYTGTNVWSKMFGYNPDIFDGVNEKAYLHSLSGFPAKYESEPPKWMLIVRDNTYVNMPLVLKMLEDYDPDCNIAIGHVNSGKWTESSDHLNFNNGILLSRASFAALSRLMTEDCPYTITSSYTLSLCLQVQKTQIIHQQTFNDDEPLSSDISGSGGAYSTATSVQTLMNAGESATYQVDSVNSMIMLHLHVGQRHNFAVFNQDEHSIENNKVSGTLNKLKNHINSKNSDDFRILVDTRTKIGIVSVKAIVLKQISNSMHSYSTKLSTLQFNRIPFHKTIIVDHTVLAPNEDGSIVPPYEVLNDSMAPSEVAALIANHPLTPKTMLPDHRQPVGHLRTHARVGYKQLHMLYPPDVRKARKE